MGCSVPPKTHSAYASVSRYAPMQIVDITMIHTKWTSAKPTFVNNSVALNAPKVPSHNVHTRMTGVSATIKMIATHLIRILIILNFGLVNPVYDTDARFIRLNHPNQIQKGRQRIIPTARLTQDGAFTSHYIRHTPRF